jgi:hypothetical protein
VRALQPSNSTDVENVGILIKPLMAVRAIQRASAAMPFVFSE